VRHRGRASVDDDDDSCVCGITRSARATLCCICAWVFLLPAAGRAVGNILKYWHPSPPSTDRHSFVTVVLPSVLSGPKGRFDRLQAIGDTWGDGANAIFVTEEDESHFNEIVDLWPPAVGDGKGTEINKSFPRTLVTTKGLGGIERLAFVLHEVQSSIISLSPSFPRAFGYVYMVNDNTFVLSSHLSAYLESVGASPVNPLYLGHPLINGKGVIFNTGSAGYVLSHATLREVVTHFGQKSSVHESCRPPDPNVRGAKFIDENPGLLLAGCLKALGASPLDTREGNGAHIFHAFGPVRTYTGVVDKWYINRHKQLVDANLSSAFEGKQPAPNPENLERGAHCCSTNTVSFHYVEGAECRALWELRRRFLEAAKVPELSEIDRWVAKLWPVGKGEIGIYSHALPKTKESNQDLVVDPGFLTLLLDILGHL